MARYFTMIQGLRGCYMPDDASVIRCDTRRDLKAAIAWQAESIRDAGFQGIGKREVAWAAAKAWRDAAPRGRTTNAVYRPSAGAILPYGNRELGRPYSVEIAPASRADYLEYCAEQGE